MITTVLLLGGNIGDMQQRFEDVRADLEATVGHIVSASSVTRSEAWGFDSEEFSNQAVMVNTDLQPVALLDAVQAIEERHGRGREEEQKTKKESGAKYLSRTIDIDIIFYGDQIVESERLTIPHLLIAKREFALEPIAQIAPHLVHPKNGMSVEQMLNDLKS